MALNTTDCRVGTIVEHFWEFKENEGKEYARDLVRTGIIVKVVGVEDGINHVLVKFEAESEAEKVMPRELNKKYPATSRQARECLRRVMGQPRVVGHEYTRRKANHRPRVKDSLGLIPKPGPAVVLPEYEDGSEDDQIGGMEVPDKG